MIERVQTVEWIFRFRWILWGLAALGAVICLVFFTCNQATRQKVRLSFDRPIYQLITKTERHFAWLALVLALLFFGLSAFAKWTQFKALALNTQDFWLFQDMLEQSAKGAPFLTRFAPQAAGWVQHGAVHPFFSWLIGIPFTWLFGATTTCLLFGPAVFTLAGAMLAVLARPIAGALGALALMAAFLASSQVGKILTYDVHPEAAYPLFLFLWAWGAGFGSTIAKPTFIRWLAAITGTLLLMGIKEDAFLVFFPAVIWALFARPRSWRVLNVITIFLGVVILILQFRATALFASGALGPSTWNGNPVILPGGPAIFEGSHWDSASSAINILSKRIAASGGFGGALLAILKFLISRPFISLLALAPWVLVARQTRINFWFLMLPLAVALALTGGQAASMMNYYGAPVIAIFWLTTILALRDQKHQRKILSWTLWAALAIGSGGMQFFKPNKTVDELKAETIAYSNCINHVSGYGIAAPHLYGLLDEATRKRVISDRPPQNDAEWNKISFALFTPSIPRFELPETRITELLSRLFMENQDPVETRWTAVGYDCWPAQKSSRSVLFVRGRSW